MRYLSSMMLAGCAFLLPASTLGVETAKIRRFAFEFESMFSVDRAGHTGPVYVDEDLLVEESREGWRQLVGDAADPQRPDLYPKRPRPELFLGASHGGDRSLKLLAERGSKVLLRAAVPEHFEWVPDDAVRVSLRVDASLSTGGSLEVEILFLDGSGERLDVDRWTPLEVSSVVAGAGDTDDDPPSAWKTLGPWSAVVPPGTRGATVQLRYCVVPPQMKGRMVLDSLELELVPVPRLRWGREKKRDGFLFHGDPLLAAAEFPPAGEGEHVVEWEIRRQTVDGGDAEVFVRGRDVRYALEGRPLRYELSLEENLPPGVYALQVATDPAGPSQRAVGVFAVLPLSPATPRHAWCRLDEAVVRQSRLIGSDAFDERGLFVRLRDRRQPDTERLLGVSLGPRFRSALPFGLLPEAVGLDCPLLNRPSHSHLPKGGSMDVGPVPVLFRLRP